MADKGEILVPEWKREEPYFHFPTGTKAYFKKPDGCSKPWRIAPEDRSQPVHESASTERTLLHIHPNAIVVGRPNASDKFWVGIFGTIGIGGGHYLYFG